MARHEQGVAADMEAMWRALGPGALRYATVLVGPDDAHDVTTNAFVRVVRLPGWEHVDDQQRYLLRAVMNEARDRYRSRSRRERRERVTTSTEARIDVEPDIDLRREIARLSVQQRAVVFLRYWLDMTEPAIAELLGVSSSTVHRHLSRARDQLGKAIQ